MTDEATQRLVSVWWEVNRLTTERPAGYSAIVDELWWAWEAVEDQMDDGSPEAVGLLIALCDAAPSPERLDTVGAGPLETLMFEHGQRMTTPEGGSLLEALAAASRQHQAFRMALGYVWYESHEVPETVRVAIPGMPLPLDQRPHSEPEPTESPRRKRRRPGRPPPTRHPLL